MLATKGLSKLLSAVDSSPKRSWHMRSLARKERMQRMFDRTRSFDLEYKNGALEFGVPRYFVKQIVRSVSLVCISVCVDVRAFLRAACMRDGDGGVLVVAVAA